MNIAGNKRSRFVLASIAFLALLMPTLALGQDKAPDKKEKKESKQNDKDDKKIDELEALYDEARQKANEKYDNDRRFRDDVDTEFRQVQREHSDYAYNINTKDSRDYLLTYSGDRLPQTDTLYDNVLAQDYVNRLGQSLVPQGSMKRYGFKITLSPAPDARSLSTGTVYVSTGLISLIDNEAQLAFVLAHEIAHVEKEHWKDDIKIDEWRKADLEERQRKAGQIGTVAGIAGGLLGGGGNSGIAKNMVNATIGSDIAKIAIKMADRNRAFDWVLAQEDEADELAMRYMLDRSYDVGEVKNFYSTLKAAAADDPRIELQQAGDTRRHVSRMSKAGQFINKYAKPEMGLKLYNGAVDFSKMSLRQMTDVAVSMAPSNTTQRPDSQKKFDTARDNSRRAIKYESRMASEINEKVKRGELQAGDGEFANIMASLKRDNGLVAFYRDMYKLAERNLDQSLAIRPDARAFFIFGKVLSLIGRTPQDKDKAEEMFTEAIRYDDRGEIPEAYFHRAVSRISGRATGSDQGVSADLKQYVKSYQQVNGGALPLNISVVYDYLAQAGEPDWRPAPLTTAARQP